MVIAISMVWFRSTRSIQFSGTMVGLIMDMAAPVSTRDLHLRDLIVALITGQVPERNVYTGLFLDLPCPARSGRGFRGREFAA